METAKKRVLKSSGTGEFLYRMETGKKRILKKIPGTGVRLCIIALDTQIVRFKNHCRNVNPGGRGNNIVPESQRYPEKMR
jgi:hypothetical protein